MVSSWGRASASSRASAASATAAYTCVKPSWASRYIAQSGDYIGGVQRATALAALSTDLPGSVEHGLNCSEAASIHDLMSALFECLKNTTSIVDLGYIERRQPSEYVVIKADP